MIELTGWILAAWTIGTALLSLASAFGAVKYQQKAFEKRQDEFRQGLKCMEKRISGVEKTYMAKPDCKNEQIGCAVQRDYHEATLIQKLDDLKLFIKDIDQKREKTKSDLRNQLIEIKTDLAILRTAVEYGSIVGSPKADPTRET